MIDKILQEHFYYGRDNAEQEKVEIRQALAAIYEIGLEVIGKDEKLIKADDFQKRSLEIRRNELRAEQRKAWAKACGVNNG